MSARQTTLARLVATAALALVGGAASAAHCPPHGAAGHDHRQHHRGDCVHAPAGTNSAQARGTVKSIDVAAGEIELAHGPIPALGMPGMTMGFPVAQPGLIARVKPGQTVEFTLVTRSAGEYVITDIAPARAH